MRFASGLAAVLAVGVAMPFVVSGAIAQDQFVGTYEKKGDYWQRVNISRSGGGKFVGSLEVATQGCQGDVKLRGSANGPNQIVFDGKPLDYNGEACRIAVDFSKDLKSIKVSHPYCGYSGVACDFNGVLKRKGRR
jgi:hypothetical protein